MSAALTMYYVAGNQTVYGCAQRTLIALVMTQNEDKLEYL